LPEFKSLKEIVVVLARSTIATNIIALASTQMAGSIIRFLYMLVIARLMGPGETGIYLYGVALYLGVMGISQFGQHTFLAQRLGKYREVPFAVLRHSLTLTLVATLIVASGLTLFVLASETDPAIRVTILCFVGAMVARVVAGWVRAAYVALENPTWIPKYEFIFRGLEALTGVSVLICGGGLLAISFVHFLFWAIEAGFALRKITHENPGALGLGWRWTYLKKVTAVSVVFLTSISAMALFPQLSIILLRNLQPDKILVGHFGIAMQFVTILMIFPVAATQAFLPRLSRAFSRGDGGRDLITAVKLVALLALAGAIVAAAYGPWFINLVLGSKYAESADLFHKLCWVVTPYAIVVFLGQCFNVIGGRVKAAIIMLLMTTTHAGFLVAYVDQEPIVAAVGSMLGAALIGMFVALHQITHDFELQGHLWWAKSIIVMVSTYLIFESGWASQTITAPVALTVGLVLTWKLEVFDPADTAAINRVLGRVSPGD
jgi:O-antigen/teichoic acid export membrane protein